MVTQLLSKIPHTALVAAAAQSVQIAGGQSQPVEDLVIVALTKEEADSVGEFFLKEGFGDGEEILEKAVDKICNARAEYDDAPEYGPPIGQTIRPVTLTMSGEECNSLLSLLEARADIDGDGSIAANLHDRLGKEV